VFHHRQTVNRPQVPPVRPLCRRPQIGKSCIIQLNLTIADIFTAARPAQLRKELWYLYEIQASGALQSRRCLT